MSKKNSTPEYVFIQFLKIPSKIEGEKVYKDVPKSFMQNNPNTLLVRKKHCDHII